MSRQLDLFYAHCAECGHIYETAEELLALYNAEVDAVNRLSEEGVAPYALWADEIFFCPDCLHDF